MMIDVERRKALLWRSVASIVLLFGLMIFMVAWILLVSSDVSGTVNAAVTLDRSAHCCRSFGLYLGYLVDIISRAHAARSILSQQPQD